MALIAQLVKKSADQNGADYSAGVAISWNTSVYQSGSAFHDGGTGLVVPGEYAGRYGYVTCNLCINNIASAAGVGLEILRGGVIFKGSGAHYSGVEGNGQSTTQAWVHARTALLQLGSGDTFTARLNSTDTAIDIIAAQSSFGIWIPGDAVVSRVLAKLNANQTAANYSTPAVVPFDATEYDTDAIFSNPGKLIIPSALNGKYGIVTASVVTGNSVATAASIGIRRTVSGTPSFAYDGFGGQSARLQSGMTTAWKSVCTQVIPLVAGHEFEAVYYENDSNVDVLSYSTLGLYAVN